MLEYCDYIAAQIRNNLLKNDTESMLASVGTVQRDLHPELGYLVSTKKTITVTDTNGTEYRITVESVGK